MYVCNAGVANGCREADTQEHKSIKQARCGGENWMAGREGKPLRCPSNGKPTVICMRAGRHMAHDVKGIGTNQDVTVVVWHSHQLAQLIHTSQDKNET